MMIARESIRWIIIFVGKCSSVFLWGHLDSSQVQLKGKARHSQEVTAWPPLEKGRQELDVTLRVELCRLVIQLTWPVNHGTHTLFFVRYLFYGSGENLPWIVTGNVGQNRNVGQEGWSYVSYLRVRDVVEKGCHKKIRQKQMVETLCSWVKRTTVSVLTRMHFKCKR